MKRLITMGIGFGAVLVLAVGTASAGYPVDTPVVTASNSAPVAGESVVVSIDGFCPSVPAQCLPELLDPVQGLVPAACVVGFTAGGVAFATATATLVGTATVNYVPTGAGIVTITATSQAPCVGTASVNLTVTAPAAPPTIPAAPPTIPRSGSDSTLAGLQLGAALAGVGIVLTGLAAVRRRRLATA